MDQQITQNGQQIGKGDSPNPEKAKAKGGNLALFLVVVFILAVSIVPHVYLKIVHAVTNSPDRSSLIVGTWVGSVVSSNGGPARWEMPLEGTGNWAVMVQAKRRILTTLDATTGTVTLCSDTGVRSTATFNMGYLSGGEADLNVVEGASSPIDIFEAIVSPREGKLFYSGSSTHTRIRGILRRGQASDFEQLCK
jgi:hypothetical protein